MQALEQIILTYLSEIGSGIVGGGQSEGAPLKGVTLASVSAGGEGGVGRGLWKT